MIFLLLGSNDELDAAIPKLILEAARTMIRILGEKYDRFESRLLVLTESDETHIPVMEWEEKEREELKGLLEKMAEASVEDTDDTIDGAAFEQVTEGEVVKLLLPNLPFDEGFEWQFERLTIDLIGQVLQRARDANQQVIATFVVNRSSTTVTDEDEEKGLTQSAVNGDHTLVAKMLHNFVCGLFSLSLSLSQPTHRRLLVFDRQSR